MDHKCPLSAAEAVDTIETIAGQHPGYRRAHAVGIGFDAVFKPNGAAASYTTAFHLLQEVPAVVRFSHSPPSPFMPHNLLPVKGMAVQFALPDGEAANLTMTTVPVFISKTPEAFNELMHVATKEPLSFTEKLKAIKEDSKFAAGWKIMKHFKIPRSFALQRYYAIHAYFLKNETGQRQPVKFEWVPVLPGGSEKKYEGKELEAELLDRLRHEPVAFDLVIRLGTPDDPTDDPTVDWPEERQRLVIGTLAIKGRREDNAEQFVFDPTATTSGLECSDDPVLKFRSPAYAESARRRLNGK